MKDWIKIENLDDWAQAQGVYVIHCLLSNKLYIGSASYSPAKSGKKGKTSIRQRILGHKQFLKKRQHQNKHLQKAFDKYGEDNFVFYVIEVVDGSYEHLLERELYWQIHYNSLNCKYGYNILPAGNKGGFGIKASLETKAKMSRVRIGKKHSEATKLKIGCAHKNKQVSKETGEKISNANKGRGVGRKLSREHVEKAIRGLRLSNPRKKKFKGVRKASQSSWRVVVDHKHFGCYKSEEEAAHYYDYFSLQIFGKNVYLNFPEYDYSTFVVSDDRLPSKALHVNCNALVSEIGLEKHLGRDTNQIIRRIE
jgi:group I intron endonuclease